MKYANGQALGTTNSTANSKSAGKRGGPHAANDLEVEVNLTLDPETCDKLKTVRRALRIPRYRALEHVLRDLSVGAAQEQTFAAFCTSGEYLEPRRIGSQQNHFKLSTEMKNLLDTLSWDCADGNKSRLARAAVDWVTRHSNRDLGA
jgi:hypothetical protein